MNPEGNTHFQESRLLGLPYDYKADPDVILAHIHPEHVDELIVRQMAVNCTSLAHLILTQTVGLQLPAHFSSVHMILDHQYLRDLHPDEPPIRADLLFVGHAGITEFRTIPDSILHEPDAVREFKKRYPAPHIAVYTGDSSSEGPVLIHATYVERHVVYWPEDKFRAYPRYNTVYARRRAIPNL